jgi:hypothetical protein
MNTWGVLAAKEAAATAGLGVGAVPVIGVGPLDGFAIGVLASGACFLAVTARARRRTTVPTNVADIAAAVASVPMPRLPADVLASAWERLAHTADFPAVREPEQADTSPALALRAELPAEPGPDHEAAPTTSGDAAPTTSGDAAPTIFLVAAPTGRGKGPRHRLAAPAAAANHVAGHKRPAARRATPRHAARHARFGSKMIGRITPR